MRTIIVDDEEIIRRGIRSIISWESEGFLIVEEFSSALEALKWMENHEVDLVVTDIRMPRMSGLEFSKLIYKNYPETKIIIVSGYAEFKYAQEAIEYGVLNYVLKPFKEEQLKEALKKIYQVLEIEKQKSTRNSMWDYIRVSYNLSQGLRSNLDPEQVFVRLSRSLGWHVENSNECLFGILRVIRKYHLNKGDAIGNNMYQTKDGEIFQFLNSTMQRCIEIFAQNPESGWFPFLFGRQEFAIVKTHNGIIHEEFEKSFLDILLSCTTESFGLVLFFLDKSKMTFLKSIDVTYN